MTNIEKLDKVSLMEKRYQVRMYVLNSIEKIVNPIVFDSNDQDLIDYSMSTMKCAVCKYCKMKFDSEDGVDMYCTRRKKSIYIIGIKKSLECRWLYYNYSDLLPYIKNHNISLDKILRDYKGT